MSLFEKRLHSIRFRFTLLFLLFGLGPILILIVWSLFISNETLMTYLEDNVFELMKQKAAHTAFQLSSIESVMDNISNIEDVILSLKEDSDTLSSYQKLKVQAKMGYILAGHANLDGVESIDIFSKHNNRYHFGKSLIKSDKEFSTYINLILEENSGNDNEVFWHGFHGNIDNTEQFSLVASKRLTFFDYNSMTNNYIGLIIVHYSLQNISQELNNDNVISQFKQFLVDGNGKIIVSPGSQNLGQNFKEINGINKEVIQNFDKVNFLGKKTMIMRYDLLKHKLTFFTYISDRYLFNSRFNILKISIFGLLSIGLFSFVIFYLSTKRILNPIKEIKDAFVAISSNNYDLDKQLTVDTKDELGELKKWFNVFIKNEEEKKRNALELKEQKEIAVRANKAKDIFLASVSHELRTPLNGVISVSELLQFTNLDFKQKEYVDLLYQSSNILYTLINQVLDFSKISSSKLDLKNKSFDLIELFDKIVKLVAIQCELKDIKFTYKNLPLKSLEVIADEVALQKIIINLIGNSIKYTVEGEINFTIEEISKKEQNITLRISVSDTGLGIPENKKSSVFDAFEQVDSSLSKKITGSGLGLSISQQLVHLMNSDIKIISPNNELNTNPEYPGSIFYFDISLKLSQEIKNNKKEVSVDFAKYLKTQSNISCLIVEDNRINQKVIISILNRYGINTEIACDWKECLAHLEQKEFDYIFMDIQMPEITGLELSQMIREKGINTPIIAVTGNVTDEIKLQTKEAGMDGFIAKPLRIEQIEKVLIKFNKNNYSHNR